MEHFKRKSVKVLISDHFLLKHPVSFSKRIGFILLFCLLALITAKEGYSQGNQHLVDVSVYWVKETVACAPNGYSSSYTVDTEGKKCAPLNKDQLHKFGKTVASKVPPKSIPLGYIGELVDDYRKKCTLKEPCKDPNDRYALVLVFKFHNDCLHSILVDRR